MATDREVEVALGAFNEKRAFFGGIKSWKEQREAMTAALEAAERERAKETK
jgi:hypothetical protein